MTVKMSNLRVLKQSLRIYSKAFSFSTPTLANRALIFRSNGNPAEVLSAVTYPTLPPPSPDQINISFRLSPINPSDINVIEGVYPSKPSATTFFFQGHQLENPVFVPGNEGLAEVTDIGKNVKGFKKGDWVILAIQQGGTWSSAKTVDAKDVIKLPSSFSEVNAATITVNPPTAYNMLHDFVDLKEGDWIMQNGANSALGQAVIQIAARKGWKTLNFLRSRNDIDALKSHLSALGATQVVTYDELSDKAFRDKVKGWTGGKIRLMLNGVSGRVTTAMMRHLGQDAHVVSYGAMSKEPLSFPTSLFIFKNLTAHGFWQSRWYHNKSKEERDKLMENLAEMKLQEPEHEIVTLPGTKSDEDTAKSVQNLISKMSEGKYGKKVLLKIEGPAD
ncbi:hypothetical protein C8Q75DRAFT_799165 [Abortiporus biennis]|nr:hypothetical protein C8Q75DRAFT_799165 [Abortiporus biennis]